MKHFHSSRSTIPKLTFNPPPPPQVTSFGYSLNEVSIRTDEGVIMDYYAENGDWAIKGMTHERSIYYDGGYPFSKVSFVSSLTTNFSVLFLRVFGSSMLPSQNYTTSTFSEKYIDLFISSLYQRQINKG